MDLCAPVHDSGMIKDLYCILILLLCCQQPFPMPNTHTCANLCSCAQLDSGSGKWEASLLWRKNRMHHFHLYGMAQWRSQSLAAETDLSTNNEGGLLHDQWLFIDNASTPCFVIVMRKMVSVLHKSHQKTFSFYSQETWPLSIQYWST